MSVEVQREKRKGEEQHLKTQWLRVLWEPTRCYLGYVFFKKIRIKNNVRASLVAQWLRICLPMQGTQVRALVWEDPTCRGATRPVSHSY